MRKSKGTLLPQILFWPLRAPDGHAKDFSIHILPRGRFRLTRLYDVMSAYPVLGDGPHQWSREIRLALALPGKNKHDAMHTIQRRHFDNTARKVGYAPTVGPIIEDTLARTPAAVAQVQVEWPRDFAPHDPRRARTGRRHIGGDGFLKIAERRGCRFDERVKAPKSQGAGVLLLAAVKKPIKLHGKVKTGRCFERARVKGRGHCVHSSGYGSR